MSSGYIPPDSIPLHVWSHRPLWAFIDINNTLRCCRELLMCVRDKWSNVTIDMTPQYAPCLCSLATRWGISLYQLYIEMLLGGCNVSPWQMKWCDERQFVTLNHYKGRWDSLYSIMSYKGTSNLRPSTSRVLERIFFFWFTISVWFIAFMTDFLSKLSTREIFAGNG